MTAHPALSPRVPDPGLGGIIKLAVMAVGGQGGGVLAAWIEDVARACGQSLRQLQRRFQSAFGITPQEFLIRTRVMEAMKLVEESRLGMAEIALRCGFVDASSFSAHFRKRTGESPRKHRETEPG